MMIEMMNQALSRRTFLTNGLDPSPTTSTTTSTGSVGRKLLQSDILAALSPQIVGSIGNTVIQIKLIKEQTLSHGPGRALTMEVVLAVQPFM
jgi:hypothetical protein